MRIFTRILFVAGVYLAAMVARSTGSRTDKPAAALILPPVTSIPHGTVREPVHSRGGDRSDSSSSSPPRSHGAAGAVAVALLASAMVVTPASSADVARGALLFENNCASCHAGGMNFVKPKRTLKREALEKFVGLDVGSVEKFFQTSMQHRNLIFPKVDGGKLSGDDVADVSSYIVNQAINDKW